MLSLSSRSSQGGMQQQSLSPPRALLNLEREIERVWPSDLRMKDVFDDKLKHSLCVTVRNIPQQW